MQCARACQGVHTSAFTPRRSHLGGSHLGIHTSEFTPRQVHTIYSVWMSEDEVGNRSALYKARRYMGDESEHVYPSQEQMPYMGVKNASGGGVTDRLAPHVGADGKIEVAPTEGDVPNATTSFHVAAQAKMKMNTVFTVLAGKGIPAGMDGSGAGVQPDGARSQFGLSELLVYRAALDKGAKTVPRGAFEKIVWRNRLIKEKEKLIT